MSLRLVAIAVAVHLGLAAALAGCAPRTGLAAVATPDEITVATQFRQRLAGDADAAATRERLRTETEALRSDVLAGLRLRERIRTLAAAAQARRANGQPLTGADLDQFNEALREGLDLTARVYASNAINALWLETPTASPDSRLAGTVLSLSGSLFLYDTWLAAGMVFASDDTLRRTLDLGDAGHGIPPGTLRHLSDDVLDGRHRQRVRAQIAFCDIHRSDLARLAEQDAALAWAWGQALASPSLNLLAAGVGAELADRLHNTGAAAGDDLLRFAAETVGGTSKLFGNAVGAVQVRHGRLFRRPEAEAQILGSLQPGDILLEKTPFRLTDKFIPGRWGHVAVWVGDGRQLRALGLWDEPLVAAHHADLDNGRGVCEALRDGVQLNTLAHFLDVDDMAVLRPKANTQVSAHVANALRQLGKAYDFNFDVETADRIVCSELAYAAFTDLAWPTQKALNRFTISPDAVASQSLDGGSLAVVELWVDGVRYRGDLAAAMAGLLAMP